MSHDRTREPLGIVLAGLGARGAYWCEVLKRDPRVTLLAEEGETPHPPLPPFDGSPYQKYNDQLSSQSAQ